MFVLKNVLGPSDRLIAKECLPSYLPSRHVVKSGDLCSTLAVTSAGPELFKCYAGDERSTD